MKHEPRELEQFRPAPKKDAHRIRRGNEPEGREKQPDGHSPTSSTNVGGSFLHSHQSINQQNQTNQQAKERGYKKHKALLIGDFVWF